MQNLTSLNLDFYRNKIDNEGAAKLGEGVSYLLNLTSLNLNLSSNGISNNGAA